VTKLGSFASAIQQKKDGDFFTSISQLLILQ
jgi:hypothetical protein